MKMVSIVTHPAFLAFLILVGVCAIGVYVIRSGQSGIAEGFENKDEAQVFLRDKLIPTFEKVKLAFEDAQKTNVSGKSLTTMKDTAAIAEMKNAAADGIAKNIITMKENVAKTPSAFRMLNGVEQTNQQITASINQMVDFINKIIKDNSFTLVTPVLSFTYSVSIPDVKFDSTQSYVREKILPTYTKLKAKNYLLPGGKKLNDIISSSEFEINNVVLKEAWSLKPESEKTSYVNSEIAKINSYIDRFKPMGVEKLTPIGTIPVETVKEIKKEDVKPDTSGLAAAAMTGEHAVLNSTLQGILKRLDGLESTKTTPCKASLDIAQGANAVPCSDQLIVDKDAILAAYKKHQETIKPHEKLPTTLNLPSLTSSLPTDKGTMADTIKAGEYLSPSVRQMIRDDVSKVVREEVEGSQYYNPHEVKYGL